MNKKSVILLSLLTVSITAEPMIVVTKICNQLTSKAESAWKTFKDDMSRLLDKTKPCTPEQEYRISAEIVGLAITAAVVTKVGFVMWPRIKTWQKERSLERKKQLVERQSEREKQNFVNQHSEINNLGIDLKKAIGLKIYSKETKKRLANWEKDNLEAYFEFEIENDTYSYVVMVENQKDIPEYIVMSTWHFQLGTMSYQRGYKNKWMPMDTTFF